MQHIVQQLDLHYIAKVLIVTALNLNSQIQPPAAYPSTWDTRRNRKINLGSSQEI